MNVITWERMKDVKKVNEFVKNIINNFNQAKYNIYISASDAIEICKVKLMGEYHCLLVKRLEESLEDSEIYLITYDGEASDGGEIHRLDHWTLEKIATQTLFSRIAD